MSPDEITEAQAVLREFGYEVHDHCRKSSDILIGLGMLQEAADTIAASRQLIDLLRRVSGKDFLLTGSNDQV